MSRAWRAALTGASILIVASWAGELRAQRPASCGQRVTELRRELGASGEGADVSILTWQLPEAAGGAVIRERAPVANIRLAFPVVLDLENLGVQGPDAGDVLARRVRRGRPLYLAVDPRYSARSLVALLRPLAGRVSELRLVVTEGGTVNRDPERIRRTVAELNAAMGGCAQARQAFARAATVPAPSRPDMLRRRLPAAVQQCRCEGVDVERLASLVREIFDEGPDYRYFRIALGDADDEGVRPIDATTSTADLARMAAAAPGEVLRVALPSESEASRRAP